MALYLLGFGCISLNGTSVTSSPPRVPQFNFTLTEYEITIPVWSLGPLPPDISVDDAKFTSSSCSVYYMHLIQCRHVNVPKIVDTLRCPSNAMPLLSLLLEASGTK